MARHPDAPHGSACHLCLFWRGNNDHKLMSLTGSCDHDLSVVITGAGERLRFETFRLDACDRWMRQSKQAA